MLSNWRSVIFDRGSTLSFHSGTGGGVSIASFPLAIKVPIKAAVTLLLIDQPSRRVFLSKPGA